MCCIAWDKVTRIYSQAEGGHIHKYQYLDPALVYSEPLVYHKKKNKVHVMEGFLFFFLAERRGTKNKTKQKKGGYIVYVIDFSRYWVNTEVSTSRISEYGHIWSLIKWLNEVTSVEMLLKCILRGKHKRHLPLGNQWVYWISLSHIGNRLLNECGAPLHWPRPLQKTFT